MCNKPGKIPGYLSLDSTSPWHISALQIAGLESMTMSSRLRASSGRQGALRDLEDTINSTGKRRIAKFEMSVADPDVLSDKKADKAANEANASKKGRALVSQDTTEDDTQLGTFDIDFFSKDYKIGSVKSGKDEQIFGRVEASRGEWDMSNAGGRDPRDRFGTGPAVQRYAGVTWWLFELKLTSSRYSAPLLFPQLDSFPNSVFSVGTGHVSKLAIHAGLTTSTAVADQVRAIEQIAKRLVGVEDRETLCNGLQVIAEEYDEGWDGGLTDSDDDD